MKKIQFALLGLILTGVILSAVFSPVQASPLFQVPSPTPDLNGRIMYTVQERDTLSDISTNFGVTLDDIRQLNNLVNDIIRPGEQLLIAVVDLEQVTPPPAPTTDPNQPQPQITPTPTTIADASAICAVLYMDVNGNGLREETDIALADGEVSVTERLGAYSDKLTTEFGSYDAEPLCFDNIPPGEYIITMALPGGFNQTTALSTTIQLAPGDTSYINFGAQPGSAFTVDDQPLPDNNTSPMMGLVGIGLLVVGLGIGVWVAINNKRRFASDED